jgi:hypothetical protein
MIPRTRKAIYDMLGLKNTFPVKSLKTKGNLLT